jgi:hypothetical protein
MMIAIFIFLGIVAVASGIATAVVVSHDTVGSRPYRSGYDSRHPQ